MNWEAIGAIGEILGAIAVLVTLVYLAAQIRQNSRFVKAATYHSTSRARNEFNFAVAMTPELSALLVRARDDSTSLVVSFPGGQSRSRRLGSLHPHGLRP